PQLPLQKVAPHAGTDLFELAKRLRRRRLLGGLREAQAPDAPQQLQRLRPDDEAALPAVEAEERLALGRERRPAGERAPADGTLLGRGEDAGEPQDPDLEVARREVAVHAREQRVAGRVEEAEEEVRRLVFLGDLQQVVGQIAAQEDAVQVFLQAVGRTDRLDGRDADELASFLLEPGDLHLGERLQLSREPAVLGPRPLRHALLLAVLAGEEGHDPVAVVQVQDVEEQSFGGDQAHGGLPNGTGAGAPGSGAPADRMAPARSGTAAEAAWAEPGRHRPSSAS